jgi:Txe/YoeB family toxin of Txe-Axe toxin-antitoxin module
MALIHVYSRRNIQSGRFVYIRKKKLEALWRDYRYKKRRSYKQHSSKKIRGTFPNILDENYKNNVLSDFDNDAYEKAKDEAIRSIGDKKKFSRGLEQRDKLVYFIKERFKIPYRQLSNELKQFGLDLSKSNLSEICQNSRPSPVYSTLGLTATPS